LKWLSRIQMSTTKRKIHLLEEFLTILPPNARLDKDKLDRVMEIIEEIHRLAKRKRSFDYAFQKVAEGLYLRPYGGRL
jgi:hypothetical protein